MLAENTWRVSVNLQVYRVLQQAYEALEQRRASAAVLSSPSFTSKSDAAYDASDDTIRLPLELRKSDIKKYAGSFSYSRPVSCSCSWTEHSSVPCKVQLCCFWLGDTAGAK